MALETEVEPEVEEPALVEMAPEVEVEPEVEEPAVELAPEEPTVVEMAPEMEVEPKVEEPAIIEMAPEMDVEPEVEEPAVVEPAVAPPVQPEEKSPAHLMVEKLATELKGSPRNHKVRLDLARASQEVQDWDGALNQYEKLITTRKFLPAVIEDLQIMDQQNVALARVRQLLGDAYVQEGQLDEALEMYRRAREALMRS
jgi:tetratricopeptide (TPR) repeat protein